MKINHPTLSCNSCRSHVDGIAYRTTCLHLLCPTCAKNSFADGHTCSICSTVLLKGEVKEAVIGVSRQTDVTDSLFQIAFSKTCLGDIVENLHGLRLAFAELEKFVSSQLLLEAAQQQEASMKEFDENKRLCIQLDSMDSSMRESEDSYKLFQLDVENIVKSRDKEMSELKDAYKEKLRKCQAWEKAYNNIRDQITAPNDFDIGSRELKSAANRKNLASSVEPSYSDSSQLNGDRQEELSKSYQYVKAHSQAPSSAHEGKFTYPPTITTQLASSQSRPLRALRRTEVTTYSKSFAPDPHNNKNQFSMQQRLEQRSDSGPTIVSAGFRCQARSGNTPRYFPSYLSPTVDQRAPYQSQIEDNPSFVAHRRDSAPLSQHNRSEQRKRSRSPNGRTEAGPMMVRQRSSFFD